MGRQIPRLKLIGIAAAALTVLLAITASATVAAAVSAPTITSVKPSSLPQGASKQSVVVGGTNFLAGAKVTSHSGITVTTTFVNATTLDLSVSVVAAETPGAYNLIVTNTDGGKFTCTGCLTVTGSDPPGADWPAYLDGPSHDSYNASATSITPSNVSNLAAAWKWLPPPSPNNAPPNLLASPTVVNGVVYQGAKDGYVFAVSESTHQTIWSRFLAINTPLPAGNPSCGVGDYQGIISTPTVVPAPGTGTLTEYVYAPDGFLYALDAATGNIVWKAQVFTPSTTVNDYYSWGSPLVANGKVYIGVSSDCDNPLVPGGLASFNQSTGAPVARWVDVPSGQLGGSIWSSPAQAADGSILVTTGNANFNGGTAEPLYNESIVRLDPTTLAPADSWQIPQPPIRDADFGASPTTWTATIGGVATPMVGACNKNGVYYAFRQGALSAGPVWQTTISVPYPGGAQECDSAATWDGTHLIETGGAPTTINGLAYVGSIRSLDPATGAVIWQTGLNGTIVGSPTEDGAGLVAAPTYQTCPITTTPCESNGGPASTLGVYLVSVANGAIVGFVPTPKSPLFGQAVFVGNDLLVGAGPSLGLTAYEVSSAGPPITGVSPSTLAPSTSTNVTLTGSGFTGTPVVTVSLDGVTASKATVVSATKLQVKLTVLSTASLGARDISVSIPGSPPTVESCTGCLTIATGTAGPTITSLSPNSLPHGASKQPVTATGTNFQSGAKVTSHSGITISTAFVSATQLNLTVSVASSVVPGAYNVIVTNPDGHQFNCKGCLKVT